MLVDGFEELANNERHGLDAFHFFLGTDEFAFEVRLLILDVTLLDIEHLEVAGKFLVADVEILLLEF